MSISDSITSLQQYQTDILAAILDKGYQGWPFGSYSTFASMIQSLPGAPVSVPRKDVNFVDYDGFVLASYTLEEMLTLSEFPALPSHNGLTCEGWNEWPDTSKEQYPRDIGAMYATDDGSTKLYITVPEGRLTVPIVFWGDAVNVDWGDGGTEPFSGSNTTFSPTHTYPAAGDYVISLSSFGMSYGLGGKSSDTCVMGANSNAGRVYQNMLRKVEIGSSITTIDAYAFQYCSSLESVTMPSYSVSVIGTAAFQYCYGLKHINLPSSMSEIDGSAFRQCHALRSMSIPYVSGSIDGSFCQYNYALAIAPIPPNATSISGSAFHSCYGLAYATIPSLVTSLASGAFYNCYGMKEYRFKPTTPPTLGNANVFGGIADDCVIYVPADSEAAYKAANIWSTYASHIVGE